VRQHVLDDVVAALRAEVEDLRTLGTQALREAAAQLPLRAEQAVHSTMMSRAINLSWIGGAPRATAARSGYCCGALCFRLPFNALAMPAEFRALFASNP